MTSNNFNYKDFVFFFIIVAVVADVVVVVAIQLWFEEKLFFRNI